MDQILFMQLWCTTLQPYILYERHNALGNNGSTSLYKFIKVTLKEPQYVDLHLMVPQFPMSFISMGLLGPYQKTEN